MMYNSSEQVGRCGSINGINISPSPQSHEAAAAVCPCACWALLPALQPAPGPPALPAGGHRQLQPHQAVQQLALLPLLALQAGLQPAVGPWGAWARQLQGRAGQVDTQAH